MRLQNSIHISNPGYISTAFKAKRKKKPLKCAIDEKTL
jgi:hypothetical protein